MTKVLLLSLITYIANIFGQLLRVLSPKTSTLKIFAQMPTAIKRRPRSPKKQEFNVVLQTAAEVHCFAQERSVELQGKNRLVYHSHQVVFESTSDNNIGIRSTIIESLYCLFKLQNRKSTTSKQKKYTSTL